MKQNMKRVLFIRLMGNHTLSCAILGINCTPKRFKMHSLCSCNYPQIALKSMQLSILTDHVYFVVIFLFFYCASYTSFSAHRALCLFIIIM